MIYLLALLAVLLAYLVHLLRNVLESMKVTNENLKLAVERQTSAVDGISQINRALRLNFKHEDDRFSETRIEELLRSGDFIDAIKYRREMSTDLLEEALAYCTQVAKRIGVTMPGQDDTK
jgi:hypothetical protein